jgi:hypothetical protein
MMMYHPDNRYEYAKAEQREALREAARLSQAKAARRSQPGLMVVVLFSASSALLALSQRLKALAEQQAARA